MANPQKRKGDKWELEVQRRLEASGVPSRRKYQAGMYNTEEPDVETDDWCIECKHQKSVSIRAYLRQAMTRCKAGKKPAVAMRLSEFFKAEMGVSGARPLDVVMITFDDFLGLLEGQRDEDG